jgi:hypothetical protein
VLRIFYFQWFDLIPVAAWDKGLGLIHPFPNAPVKSIAFFGFCPTNDQVYQVFTIQALTAEVCSPASLSAISLISHRFPRSETFRKRVPHFIR